MLLGPGAGRGGVRECSLGGPVPQGRQCGWVALVGRGMRAPQVPSAPCALVRFLLPDPLSSAVAYGFSFLCDCCSKLM